MSAESEFEEWLESTDQLRAKLLDYSRSPIPTDPGERQLDVSLALTNGQDAGEIVADLERFLALEVGKAMLAAKADHDAKTAAVLAKAATASVARLRDGFQVVYRTLADRRFALMNLNRTMF